MVSVHWSDVRATSCNGQPLLDVHEPFNRRGTVVQLRHPSVGLVQLDTYISGCDVEKPSRQDSNTPASLSLPTNSELYSLTSVLDVTVAV